MNKIKLIIVAIFGLMLASSVRAQTFNPVGNTFINYYSSLTNTTNTWSAYPYREHIFQNVNYANGTTGQSNKTIVSWSIDNTNFVPFWTNTFTTNLGTSGTTLTGHYAWFQSVTSLTGGNTNCNSWLEYEGGD